MKSAIVFGGGGFIGSHLVRRLKRDNYFVVAVDLKRPEFSESEADCMAIGDLRDPLQFRDLPQYDEAYQLAADMGGAGFIFTGEHDAEIMHNSAQINLNVLEWARKGGTKRIFYSSSACIYPARNQEDPDNPICHEASAYPAAPDSEYGWEKLFSERMYHAYQRNYGLEVRIARFHNIFGPEGTWQGGREKAPAAICRKVAQAKNGGTIELWGDGKQTRSFLYIDECVEGVMRLMRASFCDVVNIGSEEMVSIETLSRMVMIAAGKRLNINYTSGPTGVRGRNSDNRLIKTLLNWAPSEKLFGGIKKTYQWIEQQVKK